jgi:sigma-B regulation protein RsbU (phosphoserine phosphatase)
MGFLSRCVSSVVGYRRLVRELWAARKEVVSLFRFETLVHDIATRFINLTIENYDEGMNTLLRDIGRFTRVDRAYLFMVDEEGATVKNTHEWRIARYIKPLDEQLKRFPVNTYRWWRQHLLVQEYLHVSSINDLPEYAQEERRFMSLGGVQSLLIVPLIRRGTLEGFIGFDSVQIIKKWDKKEIYLLESVAQDIVNLRLRWEAERELRESRSYFNELVTSIESVFFLFSMDLSRLIYVSPAYSAIWGRSEDSLRENPLSWLEAVYAGEREEVEAEFRGFAASGGSFSREFRIRTKGGLKWIAFRAFQGEKTGGIAAAAEDVSTRKTAELQLAGIREEDLRTSAHIQKTILVEDPRIDIPCVDIAALSIPSQEVDGDFYNAMPASGDTFDVLVGDVMGKGLPGAFIAAAVRNQFLRVKLNMALRAPGCGLPDPADIVGAVAQRMSSDLIGLNSFVTLSYSRFNLGSRRFTFVDCGHTPVIHFHHDTGKCWFVKGRSPPLGFCEDEKYMQQSIPFAENDILFFYSDGITDARNPEGDFFGERRLVAVIEGNRSKSAQDIIQAVREAIAGFSGEAPLADDLTCVAVKLAGLPGEIVRRHGIFAQDVSSLPRVRAFIETCFAENTDEELPADMRLKILLAGTEAASNIITHGIVPDRREASGFYLEWGKAPDWIFLRFIYAGRPFVFTGPRPAPDIEKLQEHGYGIFIIEKFMDSVTYANNNQGGMMMTLVKRLDRREKTKK